jgi:hypothetical protein
MRFARFGLLISILFLTGPNWAQQTQLGTTPPPVTKDAQAVGIATQALAVAGGMPAITGITDYTGTGNIAYHWPQDVQGTVTVRGKGLAQFRLDAKLPSGVRSEATDGFTTINNEDGSVKELHTQPPLYPARLALPYLQLRAALISPMLSVLYKGSVDIDGRQVQDIQIQRILLGSSDQTRTIRDYLTMDFFIDPSTFQVVMMQDVVPFHRVHQIRYGDFRLVSGVSVPFSIGETIMGQETWLLHLDQMSFNSALQDSDFQL